MMTLIDGNDRNGARPVVTLQTAAAPGSEPQQSPTSATGGQVRSTLRAGRRHSTRKQTSMKKQPMIIMQWNAEGVRNKKTELEHFLHEKAVSICCIQETHLRDATPFKVRGYQCFRADRKDRPKGGVLTLIRNNINACETVRHLEGAEYIGVTVKTTSAELQVVNYYCPNDKPLSLDTMDVPNNGLLILGDFNSHSQSWGYDHLDRRGEEIEEWQDDNNLLLVNDPHDVPTFYSRRWHSTTTPDLALCTEDVHKGISREVEDQLGGSDHRPVLLTLDHSVSERTPKARWNFKKAKWNLFSHRTNILTRDIQVQGRDINRVTKEFNAAVLQAARETIPRGSRREYKPYWSNQLQELQDVMTAARNKAEEEPSAENNNDLQKAKAKFLRAKTEALRKSWREKTASLNFEKEGKKLWKLTRQLNDENTRGHKITLEVNGELLTGKQATDEFAKNYADESDINVSKEHFREARREQRERGRAAQKTSDIDKDLTLAELQKALRKLKTGKSPGPDGITNEMLIHLGSTTQVKLLEMFNLSWHSGTLPQIWREAIMIPVLKKGKDKKKAASYRPISLTSCMVKTLERIINSRLQWYLESESIIVPEQAGFRQFYSTEDQVTYLSQEIEDAFQDQKLVFAGWIDLQKAFDKVWKDGLIVKLQRYGVTNNMLKWIRSYLHNRRARVSIDNHQSRKILLRHGVPQGGVLSPTLFLIFINDLVAELPRGVKAALYADDLVLWCTEEHATTATYRMQHALDTLAAWADRWCVTINKEKSSATLFTLSNKQKAGNIKLGDTPLTTETEATYLGVTFDRRLTWKQQIQSAEAKARRKLAIMRKLAGTDWGANEQILKTVYQGAVRPCLEYGSSAWSTTAKTNQQSLNRIQNQALRLITGAMKTTPIAEMEKLTSIPPLSQRRDTKVMLQAEKFQTLSNHPMKEKLENLPRSRLKRSSFVHSSRRLKRQHQDRLPKTAPLKTTAPPRPWDALSVNLNINTTVPHLLHKEDQDDSVKKALTLAMIEETFPEETWIHAYTDGSATCAVANGGSGVCIRFPDQPAESRHFPTGKFCSNYRAEVEALAAAADLIGASSSDCQQAVILTDALSVLEALSGAKLEELKEKLQQTSKNRRLTLQWIPSHCGILGNEFADQLAKLGAAKEQPENPVTFQEQKTLIKAIRRQKLVKDDYHLLGRAEQVIIFRLRTGHSRLNCHMHRKLKISSTPFCQCGQVEQTAEHVLQDCPLYAQLRDTVWPGGATMLRKLWGCLGELRRTVQFISETSLRV